MTNLFKSKMEMPPQNDPDVVRTAQTMAEMHKNYMPAAMPQDRDVKNVERPRRGHGY